MTIEIFYDISLLTARMSLRKRSRSASFSAAFANAQDEGRVDREEDPQTIFALDHLTAHLCDRHCLAEQRLRRCRAEGDDKFWLRQRQFVSSHQRQACTSPAFGFE